MLLAKGMFISVAPLVTNIYNICEGVQADLTNKYINANKLSQ